MQPFRSQQALRHHLFLWAPLLLLSGFLQLAGFKQEWQFDRELIEQGQYWRLLSGHLVHANASHWALNMAGLALVAFFFSRYGTLLQWLGVLILSALFAGLGCYLLEPQVQVAVGLSAVLHGLFLYGALHEIRRYPRSGYLLLALLFIKLTWELLHGPIPGSELIAGGRVATVVHLYGAMGALAVWLATGCCQLSRPRSNWR